jgi:hypothetical protein
MGKQFNKNQYFIILVQNMLVIKENKIKILLIS